jgi:hypothetical protein
VIDRMKLDIYDELPRPPKTGSVRTSHLWVIEWLNESDRKTGTELSKWAEGSRQNWAHLSPCQSKADVLSAIKAATAFALKNQASPILHIETHANEEGISALGEYILWGELTPYLQELNKATKCNLVIVMAACHGFASILASTRGPLAPCVVTVGPTGTVESKEILDAMKELYRRWMDTSPKLEEITESASRELVSAELEAESFVLTTYESLVDMLSEKADGKAWWIMDIAQRAFLPRRLQKYWDTMFMINLYPENRIRFGLDVKLLVRMILRSKGFS